MNEKRKKMIIRIAAVVCAALLILSGAVSVLISLMK